MREEFSTTGAKPKKVSSQYYTEKDDTSPTDGYSYGQTKRKLKVGLEVEGSTSWGMIAFWNGTKTNDSGTWTLSFTWLGFKPSWVKFSCQSSSTPSSISSGYATWVGNENCMFNLSTTSLLTSSHLIRCGTGSLINETTASLFSFDSDGFTINWTLARHTINYQWEAWK